MLKQKNHSTVSILTLVLTTGFLLSGCNMKINDLISGTEGENSDIINMRYTSTPMSFLKFRDIPMADGTIMDLGKSSIYGDPYNWTGDLFLTAPYTFDGMFDFYNTEMKRFAWMPLGVVKGKYTIMTFLRRRRVATIQITRDDEKGSQIVVTMVTAPKNMEDYYEQYRVDEIKRGRWILHRADVRMMEAKGMLVTNEMRELANENASKKGFSTIEIDEQRTRQIQVMRGLKERPTDEERAASASPKTLIPIEKNESVKEEKVQDTLNKIQEDAEKKAEGLPVVSQEPTPAPIAVNGESSPSTQEEFAIFTSDPVKTEEDSNPAEPTNIVPLPVPVQ